MGSLILDAGVLIGLLDGADAHETSRKSGCRSEVAH